MRLPAPAAATRCDAGNAGFTSHAGGQVQWRIVYRVDADVIVIADVFMKKTQKTPKKHLDASRARLARYDVDTQRTP